MVGLQATFLWRAVRLFIYKGTKVVTGKALPVFLLPCPFSECRNFICDEARIHPEMDAAAYSIMRSPLEKSDTRQSQHMNVEQHVK